MENELRNGTEINIALLAILDRVESLATISLDPGSVGSRLSISPAEGELLAETFGRIAATTLGTVADAGRDDEAAEIVRGAVGDKALERLEAGRLARLPAPTGEPVDTAPAPTSGAISYARIVDELERTTDKDEGVDFNDDNEAEVAAAESIDSANVAALTNLVRLATRTLVETYGNSYKDVKSIVDEVSADEAAAADRLDAARAESIRAAR